MTAAVYASLEPQTQTALERHLQKSWRSVSLTTLQNLIGSMPGILKAVIRNKGDTVLTNIEPTHCLEVTLSSRYYAIFGVATLLSIIIVAEQLSV